ncbi:hypothetical protein TNCV_665821 [Trichonephila clavipes]|uniref:Uncharacterized protein n=1 Tax=Trichonephila clavipes TaxID=2585209 RepID=A0A8X6SGS9_TRICX|nr:hypothetical protein TNCV_665821 [Trichonephila clavipes]
MSTKLAGELDTGSFVSDRPPDQASTHAPKCPRNVRAVEDGLKWLQPTFSNFSYFVAMNVHMRWDPLKMDRMFFGDKV